MTRTTWDGVLRQVHSLAGVREQLQAEDADLLARFLKGDEAAFEVLLRRHGPMVLRVARRVLRSEADAEDVFQAAFLLLARKASSIRRRASVASWLYGVAHRLALHVRADQARRREHEGRATRPPSVTAWQELDGLLDEALAGLPEKYRTPLVHCYLEGRTQEEVAQLLGAPLGTVRSWIARGRELLRRRLVRRGVTLSAAGVSTALLANAAQAAALTAPGPLVRATLQAVPPFVAGYGLLPSLPVRVAGLVRAGLTMLVLARLRGVAVGLLVLTLLAIGAGLSARQLLDAPAAASRKIEQTEPAPEKPRGDLHGDPLPADALARLGTVRFRHEGWVHGIVVSPDDRTVAAVGGNGLVLWDTAIGWPRHRIAAPDELRCLALAADGKTLAVGDGNSTIVLLDPATGKELRSLVGHEQPKGPFSGGIRTLRFAPDGHTLISSGSDETTRVWDTTSGKELRQFGDKNTLFCDLSPDGKLVAVEGKEAGSLVRLLDFATGNEVQRLDLKTEAGHVAFAPDGKTLAIAVGPFGKPGKIILWDIAANAEKGTLTGHDAAIFALAFAPDGKSLISGGYDQAIRLWDLATHTERQKSQPLGTPIYALAFLHDGKGFFSSGAENRVRLWDVNPLRERLPADGPSQEVSWLAYTPDGKQVASASGNRVWLWEAGSGKLLRILENHPGFIAAGGLSADGKVLVSQGDRDVLHIWDPATGQERRHIETGVARYEHVALSPDGALAAAWSMDKDKLIDLWSTVTGKKLAGLEVIPESPGVRATLNALCFTRDGKTLFACSGTHVAILRWDVSTGKVLPPLGRHDGGLNGIALAADDRSLAAATMGGSVYLWELATGQPRLIVKDAGYATAIALSPDGRLLALANSGRHWTTGVNKVHLQGSESLSEIRVLDAANGKVVHRFAGNGGGIRCLSFSPDSRTLASGGADTTTLLWAIPREASEEKSTRLTPTELDDSWNGLGADAADALRCMSRLLTVPTQTVSLLREHLKPVLAVSAERVAPLLKQLDSDQFVEREEATVALKKLGLGVTPVLRAALRKGPSVEMRRRLEMLLDELGEDGSSPERLRGLRAMELLERIDDRQARALVKQLAEGAEGAWLTEEAKRTWQRMEQRTQGRERR